MRNIIMSAEGDLRWRSSRGHKFCAHTAVLQCIPLKRNFAIEPSYLRHQRKELKCHSSMVSQSASTTQSCQPFLEITLILTTYKAWRSISKYISSMALHHRNRSIRQMKWRPPLMIKYVKALVILADQ